MKNPLKMLSTSGWKLIFSAYWAFRASFFTMDRKGGVYYEVYMTEKEFEKLLGENYFTNDWEFSYNKRGEDINMRRPLYKDDEYKWYQLHIRGWVEDAHIPDADKKVQSKAHTELEPSEYPEKHINGVNFDADEGMMMLEKILEENEIEFSNININT